MPEPVQIDASEIVRLATVMEALTTEVRNLTDKVDVLKDTRVVDLEKFHLLLGARVESTEAQIARMEGHMTWLVRTTVAEGLSIIGGIILWAVSHYL